MAGPATKFGSLTGHGGTVIGPGCPTVLINKVPAIRIGADMHLCPMVTPGTPPIPHVGMNCVGPGVPTVLIGKMPASTVGDTFLCVGPPAPVVTGAFDVLIGTGGGSSSSGGGGGGGGSSAASTGAAESKQPVKGSETFPVDIQATIKKFAKYKTPAETQLLIGQIAEAYAADDEDKKKEKAKKLTIADFVEILEAVEREENYEAARFFASHLNYMKLTKMAMAFTKGKDPDSKNDPNQMPTRFMLLYGMDDSKLKTIDKHPDNFESAPAHKINIANVRKGLRLLGYKVAENGPYNDEVLKAHAQYLASATGHGTEKTEEKYTTKKNDSLGSIAHTFGLVSWKYLYQINKDIIGDNPDLLKEGTVLTIPQWDATKGDEKIVAKEADPKKYVGALGYRYVWVPISITLCNEDDTLIGTDDSGSLDEKKKYIIEHPESHLEFAAGSIKNATEIETLIPDHPHPLVRVGNQQFMVPQRGMH